MSDNTMELGLRVLVVDDEPVNCLLLQRICARFGCETASAGTGRAAVVAVREGSYDVVFMDCEMPELDGYEATAQIRALPSDKADVPIYAVTAAVFPDDVARAFRSGMNGHLPKPISVEVIRDTL